MLSSLHDQRRGLSMPKESVTVNFDKFFDIWGKIGRKKHGGDEIKVITYIALNGYVKTIEPEILKLPAYITVKNNDVIKNPYYEILEAAKEEITRLDKSLRLSFWAKKD